MDIFKKLFLRDYEKTLKKGDVIQFEGVIHPSVGIHDYLEYNKDAFMLESSSFYTQKKPDCFMSSGGDEQVIIYKLICLKKGRFIITEVRDFRGEKTILAKHSIRVTNK